ncbi:hypothetical protein [Acaricomes phytoseiuli]|uniref:hypothetical protein n=1 Tax=Acaricomes phytoseiuli TaxID=291968 RepID=UPI000369E78C|nr:hypothetical protein [Acaricomes phytoseiuli]
MTIKIISPIEGHTAKTEFGPAHIEFIDGEAHVDELPDGVRAYLLQVGYEVTEDTEVHAKPKRRGRSAKQQEEEAKDDA